MSYFNIVAETTKNTVITEYKSNKKRVNNYQNEADLEKEFIQMLTEQGYDYLPIHSENDFKAKVMRSLQSHYESVSKMINIVKTFCPRKQSPI